MTDDSELLLTHHRRDVHVALLVHVLLLAVFIVLWIADQRWGFLS